MTIAVKAIGLSGEGVGRRGLYYGLRKWHLRGLTQRGPELAFPSLVAQLVRRYGILLNGERSCHAVISRRYYERCERSRGLWGKASGKLSVA